VTTQPQTPCDLCASPTGTVLFSAMDHREGLGGPFRVVQCDQCGLVRTEPRPEDLARYYPAVYRSHAGERSLHARVSIAALRYAARARGAEIAPRLATWVVPAAETGGPLRSGASILDVGAGSGAAVAALRQQGFDAWGVEPSPTAVEIAHAAGRTTVVQGTLEDAKLGDRPWDVVRFNHVLEHVPSPHATLLRVRQILSPRGHVVIVVPNFGGAGRRLFGASWDGLELPRHLHHFTPATIERTCAAAGLRLRTVRTAALFGLLPATIDAWTTGGRRQRGWSRSIIAKAATYPVELALSAVGLGDGLVAIATHAGD
jgi:2-polyprenyl-3-methyl-5-hydroxy-6-metoxy-1,4-benzoquinol methylase